MTTPPSNALSQDVRAFLMGLVDTLGTDFDVEGFLTTFVARSVVLLGMNSAALLLAEKPGTLKVAAHSGEPARIQSILEVTCREGPSIDAHRTGQARWHTVGPALTQRWPHLAAAARRAGITAVLVVPMRRQERVIGVLTLLADRPIPSSADTLTLARSVAEAATIGLLNLRTVARHEHTATQLQTALATRIVIEQAKGMVAGRLGVTVADAFALLRDHARAHNRDLHALAQEVIDGRTQITRG